MASRRDAEAQRMTENDIMIPPAVQRLCGRKAAFAFIYFIKVGLEGF
jgi:hypothetical protein